MVNPVKELFQVYIHYYFISFANILACLVKSLVCILFGSKSKTIVKVAPVFFAAAPHSSKCLSLLLELNDSALW